MFQTRYYDARVSNDTLLLVVVLALVTGIIRHALSPYHPDEDYLRIRSSTLDWALSATLSNMCQSTSIGRTILDGFTLDDEQYTPNSWLTWTTSLTLAPFTHHVRRYKVSREDIYMIVLHFGVDG